MLQTIIWEAPDKLCTHRNTPSPTPSTETSWILWRFVVQVIQSSERDLNSQSGRSRNESFKASQARKQKVSECSHQPLGTSDAEPARTTSDRCKQRSRHHLINFVSGRGRNTWDGFRVWIVDRGRPWNWLHEYVGLPCRTATWGHELLFSVHLLHAHRLAWHYGLSLLLWICNWFFTWQRVFFYMCMHNHNYVFIF